MGDIFDLFIRRKKRDKLDLILKRLDKIESFLEQPPHKIPKKIIAEKSDSKLKDDVIVTNEHFLSKNPVQKLIIDILSSEEYTTSSLKNRVVDELSFCSKATFYRQLAILKRQKIISIMSLNGNDRVYIVGSINKELKSVQR